MATSKQLPPTPAKPPSSLSLPSDSDPMMHFIYIISVHHDSPDSPVSFEAFRDAFQRCLTETLLTVQTNKSNFKDLCNTNPIQILTRCNFKQNIPDNQPLCDNPLLHVFLVDNANNDPYKRVRAMARDIAQFRPYAVVVVFTENVALQRKHSTDQMEYYETFAPGDTATSLSMKQLLYTTAQAVTRNYELRANVYAGELKKAPPAASLFDVKRYAALCFEASVLSEKVGDFDQALSATRRGLRHLELMAPVVMQDAAVLKGHVFDPTTTSFHRHLNDLTPRSVFNAKNRLEAYVQMVSRLKALYFQKRLYRKWATAFLRELDTVAAYFDLLRASSVAVPFLFPPFFAYDACAETLRELERIEMSNKNTVLFSVDLRRFLAVKQMGELFSIYEATPNVLYWDSGFYAKEPVIGEPITFFQTNETLSTVWRNHEGYNACFETALTHCLATIPEAMRGSPLAFLLKRQLALFYFQANNLARCTETMLELLQEPHNSAAGLCYCALVLLHASQDPLPQFLAAYTLLRYREVAVEVLAQFITPRVEDASAVSPFLARLEQTVADCLPRITPLTLRDPRLVRVHTLVVRENVLKPTVSYALPACLPLDAVAVSLLDYKTPLEIPVQLGTSAEYVTVSVDLPFVGRGTVVGIIFTCGPFRVVQPLDTPIFARKRVEPIRLTVDAPLLVPRDVSDWSGALTLTLHCPRSCDTATVDFNGSLPIPTTAVTTSHASFEWNNNTLLLHDLSAGSTAVTIPLDNSGPPRKHELIVAVKTAQQQVSTSRSVVVDDALTLPAEGVPVKRNGRLLLAVSVTATSAAPITVQRLWLEGTSYTSATSVSLAAGKQRVVELDVTGIEKPGVLVLCAETDVGVVRREFLLKYSPPSFEVNIDFPHVVRSCLPFALSVLVRSCCAADQEVVVTLTHEKEMIVSGFLRRVLTVRAGACETLRYECTPTESGVLRMPVVMLSAGHAAVLHVAYEQEAAEVTVLPAQDSFFAFYQAAR